MHPEVIEDLPALGDFGEKAAASGFVFPMLLQVLREKIDLGGKDCNLNVGGTCVLIVDLVFHDELFLDCAGKHIGDAF